MVLRENVTSEVRGTYDESKDQHMNISNYYSYIFLYINADKGTPI